MAASRPSPLMRDQWRAEEDYRSTVDRRDRDKHRHRPRSPAFPKETEGTELGLKIKGRANTDTLATSRPRDRSLSPRRLNETDPHRSSKTRVKGERSKRELVEESFSSRYPHRGSSPSAHKRRRTRSVTPKGADSHHRQTVRRNHSPKRVIRAPESSSTRRERVHSPRSSSRRDYDLIPYSSRPLSPDRSARDSYIPSSHLRRSKSPVSRNQRPLAFSRPRSRSLEKRQRPRHTEDDYQREHHIRKYSPRRARISSSPHNSRDPSLRRRAPQFVEERLPEKRSFEKRSRHSRSTSAPKSRRPDRPEQLSRSPKPRDRKGRKMQSSTRPIQSILDDEPRQPSPPRPIPSFDDSNGAIDSLHGQAYPMHGMKASDMHSTHRRVPPHIDTRQSFGTSPQFMTPTSSHHGSPQSGSPYGHGRGGWSGQQQHFHNQAGANMNAYSPPFRQNSYPPPNGAHSPYYPNNQHNQYAGPQPIQPGFQSPSFRGGHSSVRGNHYGQQQDRRFSSSGPSNYGVQAPRGRAGHFQNLQWTASGGTRGRGQADQSHSTMHQQGHSQSPPPGQAQIPVEKVSEMQEDDNPFRPSKDLQVEDQSEKDVEMENGGSSDGKKMPPPSWQSSENSQSKEGSKISFAFKAKPAPPTTAKPVPDLVQKMKEPPSRRDGLSEKPRRKEDQPLSKEPLASRLRIERRGDVRFDRRDDRRERDYRDDFRYRDDRRDDRRFDYRPERRPERDRERERSPEPKVEKRILRRLKPRRKLPPEYAASDSVYYRKPGNESVVGSGTYGKVFKAVHVYTNNLVALKKIRMDCEKDGYPVTAVREIKLLQSLKHDNVVGLLEVMVEKNDCFMVFEYLSHDLTGLLNHPTFKLEHAHKKHLAKQLFEGLDYLHRRGVLHRDIKAANILVSNNGQLKLADFGLARFFAKRRQLDYTNRVITIWYRPPELLLGETQYGPAVDIWSAACVMIEIFTKHAIFPGDGGEINQLDKVYNILGTPTKSEWPGLVDMPWFELLRPTERRTNIFAEKYRERLTPAAFELLQAMFLYDPAKRPTAGDVLEHPYFTTEEPVPAPAVELQNLEGDWHEFESKNLRRENERKDKEARRAVRQEEQQREKEKRRASETIGTERETKRTRTSSGQGGAVEVK